MNTGPHGEIAGALLDLIQENLLEPGEPLAPDSDLFAAGLDSMGIMQLLILIEERFGIPIAEVEVTRENFATADALASLIRRLGTGNP